MHLVQIPEPSRCLEDYWVFHDKAATKNVHWGNHWLQQPKLYATFLKVYSDGTSYQWPDFRKRYCDLS